MSTDFRALCAELTATLAERIDDKGDAGSYYVHAAHLLIRARAALAEEPAVPQPQPPAEGEVGELVNALKGIAYWRRHNKPGGPAPAPFDIRQADRLDRAADLLHRLAAPVLEPALARINDILNDSGRVLLTDEREALELARQALEQRKTAPAPVPVAERLPGPEDCDAEGRCWLFSKVEKEWRLIDAGNPGVPHLKYCFSHWLPAHALPIPHQQENANDH